MSGITRDDWIRALEEAGAEPVDSDTDAMTAIEAAEMFGIDRQAAIRRLKVLEKAGKAMRTRKAAPDSMGRTVYWQAWKLVVESDDAKRPRTARKSR